MKRLKISKSNQNKKYRWYKENIIVVLLCLIIVSMLSIGYATLIQNLQITGDVIVRADVNTRITDISFNPYHSTCGYDNFNPKFTVDTFKVNLNLPEIECVIVYTLTIRNRSNLYIQISDIIEELYNNEDIIYEFSNLDIGNVISPNSTLETQITFKYRLDLTSLPNNTSLGAIIRIAWTEHQTNPAQTDITITFMSNGADAIGAQTLTCSFSYPETSCNIVAPTINRAGFTALGWHISSMGSSSLWNIGTMRAVSSNETWYAITVIGLRDIILADNVIRTGADFSVIANNANRDAQEGLFQTTDDLGISYFFRGTHALNNNVIFAGHQWKIVRIDGAGNVRLIYNGICLNNTCNIFGATSGANTSIGLHQYNTSVTDPRHVGYMFGTSCTTYDECHANENDSNVKQVVDNFVNSLPANARALLIYTHFCNDRSLQLGDGVSITTSNQFSSLGRLENRVPTLHCPLSTDSLSLRAGLITADEIAMAGGVRLIGNPDLFLRTGQAFWTMTPLTALAGPVLWMNQVNGTGVLTVNQPISTAGVRPVISLSPIVQVASGNGSASTPYIIAIP